MRKLELVGEIDPQGKMVFEHLPLPSGESSRVRVTIEYIDTSGQETDPDDTPTEEVLDSLRRSVQQIKAGERIPLSEIWDVLSDDETSGDN